MGIVVKNLSKRFGEFQVVDGVSFEVPAGELVALLGPTGSGKSTILRIIAGLEQADSGDVELTGEDATNLPVQRRGVGFVFQHYALFPHMTVGENIAFGMKVSRKKRSKAAIAARVDELLRLVQLEGLANRFPSQISGGQRQRVALARALAVDPKVLLLDEPFGALDALTRRNLQDELLRIWTETKKTILFVTHSIEEAIYLADRIVVMTYRPGTVKRDLIVDLPRLRDPASPAFNELKRELGHLVMEEQQRHHTDERRMAAVD